jgi:hypothetical protein
MHLWLLHRFDRCLLGSDRRLFTALVLLDGIRRRVPATLRVLDRVEQRVTHTPGSRIHSTLLLAEDALAQTRGVGQRHLRHLDNIHGCVFDGDRRDRGGRSDENWGRGGRGGENRTRGGGERGHVDEREVVSAAAVLRSMGSKESMVVLDVSMTTSAGATMQMGAMVEAEKKDEKENMMMVTAVVRR